MNATHRWARVGLAALVGLLATTAAAPQDEKPLTAKTKAALPQLAGKWEVTKVGDGDAKEELKGIAAYWAFNGAEVTFSYGDKSETLRVLDIDPTTDPKCIDLEERRKGRDPRVLEGVYRVDGDTLRLAFAVLKDGKSRPTGFDKPADPRTLVITFKRVKE